MQRHYFGTDGVRGPYGGPVMNEGFVWRLGVAAGRWLKTACGEPPTGGRKIFVGRDTRFSGPLLETAIMGGLASEGFNPVSLGVVPTPAVSLAIRRAGAVLGVVITASHNPAEDNGIKFFGAAGIKLMDEDEGHIEQLLPPSAPQLLAPAAIPDVFDAKRLYLDLVEKLLPPGALAGWSIVLDTANGAACETSPTVLSRLGAKLALIGNAPDGHNINAGVGSQHPEKMCALVKETGARLGIAHDGDADRCILCDERGGVLDGDEILTMLAVHALQKRALAASTLVVTVQSNLGVDAAVEAAGGRVERTPVGDRYVSERMLAAGATLGGESSGHVICSEISPTGDGLVAALKVIEVMLATGRPLSELRRTLHKFPQVSADLKVREKRDLASLPNVQAALRAAESELAGRGRVLVRYSGTEAKIRLLVEGERADQVAALLERLKAAVRADLPAG